MKRVGDGGPNEKLILKWFQSRGWRPFDFQRKAWSAHLADESGLIHSPTGTGKTYAACLPPIIEWLNEFPIEGARPKQVPLRVLWITPLRALAADTAESVLVPQPRTRPAVDRRDPDR